MKKLFFLFISSVLFAQEKPNLDLTENESLQIGEIAAFDPTQLAQPPIEEMQVPAPHFEMKRKSPAVAVSLSALFPGLGHLYLGEKATAAELIGTTFAGMGGLALSSSNEQAFEGSVLTLQTTWSYGLYASYRDVRLFNGNAGYSYKMPADSFADLSFASFRWKILKKPEVWGGFLGAIGLAAATTYFIHISEARLPSLSIDTSKIMPVFAFPIGISEEALFRGCLQPMLMETFGPRGGILLSSLAFGAMHIPNALFLEPEERKDYYAFSLPLITALGAYFGWLTYKNNSLQESVAIHSWYDFTLFAISSLATQTAATGRPGFALAIPF